MAPIRWIATKRRSTWTAQGTSDMKKVMDLKEICCFFYQSVERRHGKDQNKDLVLTEFSKTKIGKERDAACAKREGMNLFDILGPVMVGPSSSHTAGQCGLDGHEP